MRMLVGEPVNIHVVPRVSEPQPDFDAMQRIIVDPYCASWFLAALALPALDACDILDTLAVATISPLEAHNS